MKRRNAAGTLVALIVAACTGTGGVTLDEPEPVTEAFVGETWITTSGEDGPSIEVGLLAGGVVGYQVVDDGEVVVDISLIGVETSLGSLAAGLSVDSAGEVQPWSDSYDSPTGKERSSTLEGAFRSIRFDKAELSVGLIVDTIATESAVAFRTTVIGDAGPSEQVTVEFERTSFLLDALSTAWMQAHDQPSRFGPAYERIYSSGRPVAAAVSNEQGWNLPALFRSGPPVDDDPLADSIATEVERWTLLAEAGLASGWAGSHLGAESSGGEFFMALPDEREGNGVGSSTPTGTMPFTSPWRVVLTSTELGEIVESDIVRHLSAPAEERDWSWVEPGRVSWSWWSEPDSPKNPDRLIDFVDLAAELEWEYSLIDANWNEMSDSDFGRVLARAAERDVGVLLWYNSGGPHNLVTEAPRDRMFDPATRRDEMARIAALGVSGVKVDFFHSDKPEIVDLYLAILEDAADHELLVNFHGSTVPRGWSRTWPNLMTMEAVAGGEQYLFNEAYPTIAPAQNVVLAFTRNVVGPMDYTPTMLQDQRPRRTTDAHELALAVVYESSLTHFIDTPEIYLDQPDEVRAFLRDVPTVWDDTVLLDGSPDSHVAIARQSESGWWIGAINGSGEGVAVDLSVVGGLDVGDGASTVDLICDGVNPEVDPFTFGTISLDELELLRLPPFGGCVAHPSR